MTGGSAKLRALEASEQQRRLSRDDLLRAHHVEEDVFIHSMGGAITMQSMSVRARAEIRAKAKWGTPEWSEETFNLYALIYGIKDPKLTEDDIEALRDQDASVYEELLLNISLINMTGRGEEVGKDSKETSKPDSSSDSASVSDTPSPS